MVNATISRFMKFAWIGWLALIMVSTVFVHQHHLIDILTGLLTATAIHLKIRENEDLVLQTLSHEH
jgi:membrane-associated phospholipid phosphatase